MRTDAKQAQSTTEFLVVLSVVLITFLIILAIYTQRAESVRASDTLLSAKDVASRVGRAINQVYKAGNSSYQIVQLEPKLDGNVNYSIEIEHRRVEVSWGTQSYDYPIVVERVYLIGGDTFNVTSQSLLYKDVTAMTIGDGNNSGLNSFYAGVKNSDDLHQILENGSYPELGDCGNKIYAICVADADQNLAGNEVYVGQFKVGQNSRRVYQYHWNGTAYNITDLGDRGYAIVAMACGDGDHDSKDEIYFARQNSKDVYELKHTGGVWVDTNIGGLGFKVFSLAVGDGDNDGFDEVYAGDKNGYIYKYEYIAGAYVPSAMSQQANDVAALAVGDGDNDGSMETYFAITNDANLYEVEDDGSVTNHGGLGFKAVSLAVGDPFNIGTNQVYLGDKDYNIYEYSIPQFDASGQTLFIYNDEGVITIGFS